jgi:hypothetical protein
VEIAADVGEGSCGSRKRKGTGRKEQIAKVREKTKGCCSVWRRQVEKVANPYGACL